MKITTDMIKKLREVTGSGFLDCKAALSEANGDFSKAVDILREKGQARAEKRATRDASEGVIEVYSHGGGRLAVMVEVNCETDFVGRSPEFLNLAHELALQIAAADPLYLSEDDIPQEKLDREARIASIRAEEEGKPEHIIPKIVEGYLAKYKKETVLMNQVYIRDDSKTIKNLVDELEIRLKEKIIVRRFVRWALGVDDELSESASEE